MTCIVGIEHKGKVWMGGDSAATSSSTMSRTIINEPKVFVKGPFVFGVAGSPKVLNALSHAFDPPRHPESMTDQQYIVRVLIPAMREMFVKLDCAHPEKRARGMVVFDSEILMGYKGKLYSIAPNFQVTSSSSKFDSIGSGEDIAKGSLQSSGGDPKVRIIAALKAASVSNAGVAPPFVIIKG